MTRRPSTGTELQRLRKLSFAVEDAQGTPIAYVYATAGLSDYPVSQRYPGLVIYRIGVHKAYQRRRLGPLLLLTAAQVAQARGIGPWVTLETAEGNERARSFYESLGFQAQGTRREMKRDPVQGNRMVTYVEYAAPIGTVIERAEAMVARHYTGGLKELAPGATALDGALRQTVRELILTWPENVRRYYQNLDDPAVRFAVHLGARVRGSSSPPALTYLYNEVAPLPGIRLVSIPLDTAPGALAERLTQIVAHPRVVLVTSTEPHKPAVAQWMKTHASGIPDARVRMIPSTNNAWLHRAADGTVARAVLSNSDGPSFVTQYQRVWGRHDGQDGTFRGQRVVILGGWGGLSQAVVISVLQEHPASLVISEKVNVSNARQELPRIAATLGIDSSHVAVFGPQEPGLNDALRAADVVVNATGIGQDEHDARSPIADGAVFERPAGQRVVAIDSIYRTHAGAPRPVTPFLQQAWTYGVRDVYNGVGLYVRDFAWEAAWITEQVTGTSLDESQQEAIYQQVYRWARETRGLREAREVLEAGGLEETARAEEVDAVLTPLFEPMRPAVIRAITGPIMVCIAPSLLDLSQLSEPELVEQFAILERRLLASFGNDLRVTVTLNVHEAAEAEARGIAVFRLVRTKSRHEPKSWGIVVIELPPRQRLELAALVPLVVRGLSHAPRGVEQVPADPYLELGVTLPEALDALERYL